MALIHFWTWLFARMGVALPYGWAWFLSQAVFIVVLCLVLMLSVAVVILADRKIWAAVQMRRGPNVVGPFGLLQTIADALKFFFKEVIIPAGANKLLFLLAPIVSVVLAFISDYYLTNAIARASETMAKCSQEFVTGTSKMAAE